MAVDDDKAEKLPSMRELCCGDRPGGSPRKALSQKQLNELTEFFMAKGPSASLGLSLKVFFRERARSVVDNIYGFFGRGGGRQRTPAP